MRLKIILGIIFIPVLVAFSTIRLEGIFGLQLKNLDNETFPLSQLNKNKASVIVFLLPDCPACESYSATLNTLRNRHKNSGFEFYGIFPGKFNSVDEMKAFRKTYKIEFPLLQDPEKILVQALHASTVPSAYLLNNQAEVLYKGRIDDWMYALGKKRAVITKHELRDALDAFNEGKTVLVKETIAIGCILE